MSYKLTNISGGQIVCDLAVEGKTLRLDNKQSTTIKDTEITQHIKNNVERGLILSEHFEAKTTKATKTTTKSSVKEKEE